jgi:hypothetical protein
MLGRLRQENPLSPVFQAWATYQDSISKIKTKLNMMVHSSNPSTQEAEAEGFCVQGQHNYIKRPYLKLAPKN